MDRSLLWSLGTIGAMLLACGSEDITPPDLSAPQFETTDGTSKAVPQQLTLPVASATHIWWSDSETKKIQRVHTDGNDIQDILVGLGDFPNQLAIHETSGKIYWGVRRALFRADLDGSNAEQIWSNTGSSQGVFNVVAEGDYVYWSMSGAGRILRADLDGSNVRTILANGRPEFNNSRGLVVDPVGGMLYIGTWTLSGTWVYRASIDDTGVSGRFAFGFPGLVWGAAIDPSAGSIYWTTVGDPSQVAIRRTDLGSTFTETLLTASDGLVTPMGIALDLAVGRMYWSDLVTNDIHRANLDGSGAELIVSGLGNPRWIDLEFPLDPVAKIEANVERAVEIISNIDLQGANGLITKLSGQGGVVTRVVTATTAFEAGQIDAVKYAERLDEALLKLDAFDAQLAEKIENGQVIEPEASLLIDISWQIRTVIEDLIP